MKTSLTNSIAIVNDLEIKNLLDVRKYCLDDSFSLAGPWLDKCDSAFEKILSAVYATFELIEGESVEAFLVRLKALDKLVPETQYGPAAPDNCIYDLLGTGKFDLKARLMR